MDPHFESLLEHVDWARRLAGRLVADAARADDVVQTALAAAAKSPPRDATNLRGWLGEVVRNAARGVGREEARRLTRERAAAKREALESTDEIVARAERTRDLAEHVLALDAIHREVVLLRWYEDLAPREIAQRLDVPVATVNSRLARAHGELRARLDRSYGDRATWCAAFVPFAAFSKPTAPLGAISLLALAIVATVVAGAAWLGGREPEREVAGAPLTAAADVEDARAPLASTTNESGRELDALASSSAAERVPASAADASAPATAIGPLQHVVGRAIGFDGRGIGGLVVVGRDPTLPRIENGWIHVGNRAQTIDEHELWECRNVPEALEHTLKHFGNPPGLRDVLLGVEMGARTTTDAEGAFALDVPGARARLELDDASHVIVSGGTSPTIGGEVLLVAPAVRVAGAIVDARGDPVAGARVHAQGANAAIARLPFELQVTAWESFDEVISDAVGRFDLGAVASFDGARITASLDTQYVADVAMPTADTRELVLVATIRPRLAKPHVRGVVLDARGAGIAGASVRLAGNAVNTDDNGRFDLEEESFDLEAELVAIKPGHAPGWVSGLGRELREKRLVEDVEIRLAAPPRTITGVALDAGGAPLAGWSVTIADGVKYPTMGIPVEFAAAGLYGEDQQPRTDARGRFELPGLASQPYRIRLVDRASGVVFDSAPIDAGSRDVEIRLPADAWRDRIRGRVVSTRGAPVADVEVKVLFPISESRGSSSSGFAQGTRADARGVFELEHVPRRKLRLSVGGRDIRGEHVAIPDDVDPNDVVVTVQVERTFHLETADAEGIDEFEVLDAAGKRLRVDARRTNAISANLRTSLDAGRWPVCTTSEEGATIVLYSKGREVRRAPITWTGERVQVLRP